MTKNVEVGHIVVKIEPTEPSVGQMQVHSFAQPSLEANAIAVADNQYPQHEFRVDRGPADVAVEWRQLLAQVSQHPRHHRIDPAQ